MICEKRSFFWYFTNPESSFTDQGTSIKIDIEQSVPTLTNNGIFIHFKKKSFKFNYFDSNQSENTDKTQIKVKKNGEVSRPTFFSVKQNQNAFHNFWCSWNTNQLFMNETMKFSNLLISSNQNQALLFLKQVDSKQSEVGVPYMEKFDYNNNQKELYFYRRVLENSCGTNFKINHLASLKIYDFPYWLSWFCTMWLYQHCDKLINWFQKFFF